MNYIHHAGASAPPNQSAYNIYVNVIAWWSYEQNNSDAYWDDQHTGNHDATLFSGTTSGAGAISGKQGRYAGVNYVSGESTRGWKIPRSDTVFDFGDTDFSICTWFYAATDGIGFQRDFMIFGRWGSTGNRNYGIVRRIETGGTPRSIRFRLRDAANSTTTDLSHSRTDFAAGTWYLLTLVHDSVNNELRAYIDTTKSSTAHSGGVYSGGTANLAVTTAVEGDSTYLTFGDAFTCNYDETFVTAYAMVDADVAYIANSGTGRSYAGLKADAGF